MPSKEPKSVRITLRLSPQNKTLLSKAASLQQRTISEFLLEAGIAAARTTLARQPIFRLSPDQWDQFLTQLDRPVTHKPRLERLIKSD
jgi:uncharacterized protein (DUF1778 family)